MWHRQKKSQNEENSVPVVPVKPSQAPAIPPKSGEKKSFKKRILQFSGLTSAHNVEGKLSAAEIKRLEETKNRLFKQGGAKSPERDPNDPLRSPLKTLTASPNQISQPSSSSTSPRSDMSSDLTYSLPKTFNIPNLSLPALESVQIKARDVVLHRNVAGDFGFTIRRIQYPITTENGTEISHLVFAEPVDHLNGPPRPSDLLNGLLPGDQLLQVEGRDVNRLKRDELLTLIQEAGQSIRLRVQVVPELAELATKTAVSGDQLQLFSQFKETDLNIPEDKRYWLVHSAGYSLVEVVDHQPDGLVKIKVADQEMTVDSSDLDKANPPNFDRANDIAALKNINETSAIHLLRNRLGSGLQYTSAGPRNLIYMASQSQEIKGLNQDLIRLFKGCRRSQMPAHIYTTAQQVYRQLQITSRPQSVVFNGVSGSGKSQQIRNFIEFLCGCAGWTKRLTYEEISLAIGILEAFGNCSTELNQNSSRFVQLISLGFDTASGLNSAKIQTLFLDLEKLTSRKPTDSTFHIFYYLWEGLDTKTFESLGFDLIDRPFFDENLSETDRNAASEAFHRVLEAFRNLNFSENQILAVQKVLAAILHLIYSGAQGNLATKSAFTRHSNAEKAADLLGISFDQLNLAVFKGSQNFDQSSRYKLVNQTGNEALQSFVQALYNELFGAITNQINKYLNKSTAFTTISLLDIPGSTFLNSTSEPADLSDFIYNYYNERISELFYKSNFKSPLDLYEREKVEVEVERPLATPAHLCRLIDRKQQLLNSADVEKRSEEPRGIFFVLEEESVFPGANENSLIERVFMHWEESKLVRRSPKDRFQFNLGHGLNQFSVGYKVNGWLKKIKPSGAIFALTQVLQNTESPYISELFTVPGLKEGSYKLRRATQSVNEIVASVGGGGGSFGGFFTAITSQFVSVIEAFQRECRLHLSRKWLEKRRIQEQAITCLQRNLSQYLKLREWPWWKLFVRVVPLLGVARADENEKQWKQQLQKLESQNSELKQSRNQMDEQLRDIENLLKTECQTSQNLANSLERESAMRVRLEAEIRHLKTKLVNLGWFMQIFEGFWEKF
uniref:Unconventional myosin-XVIIIa n=1 Tax=Bursaphelenchus xylophilus TaxID=6326 RepID=A0A1I7S251_BURXY